MKAKRVLVTGGAGFIPSNFVRHILQATPYEVVSLDALTYAGSMDNLAAVSRTSATRSCTATSATRISCARSSPTWT